jgi:hypothetical protein
MKYAEAIPGAAVLVLRLLLVPAGRWALDWVAVLALFWIAVVVTRDNPRSRGWVLAAACAWLAVIYAVNQGPHTFDAWR